MVNSFEDQQHNALMTALINAAEGEKKIYEYLDETPKASLVTDLTQQLNKLGYRIVKTQTHEPTTKQKL